MPFQALPIALRSSPGEPVAKLAWIYIVHKATIDDAPNGMAFVQFETDTLARFCQCDRATAVAAVESLVRQQFLGLVNWKAWGDDTTHDEAFADVNLPMTQLRDEERRRIKASPDEINALIEKQEYRCVTCGKEGEIELADWHVDHIIPRSVGGADVASNCQVLCSPCNRRKAAKLHFIDYLGGRR